MKSTLKRSKLLNNFIEINNEVHGKAQCHNLHRIRLENGTIPDQHFNFFMSPCHQQLLAAPVPEIYNLNPPLPPRLINTEIPTTAKESNWLSGCSGSCRPSLPKPAKTPQGMLSQFFGDGSKDEDDQDVISDDNDWV